MDMSQSRRKEGIKTVGENRPKLSHFTPLPEKLNYYKIIKKYWNWIFPSKYFLLNKKVAYFWHENSTETFWLILNHCVDIWAAKQKSFFVHKKDFFAFEVFWGIEGFETFVWMIARHLLRKMHLIKALEKWEKWIVITEKSILQSNYLV